MNKYLKVSFIIIVLLLMIFSLNACGSTESGTEVIEEYKDAKVVDITAIRGPNATDFVVTIINDNKVENMLMYDNQIHLIEFGNPKIVIVHDDGFDKYALEITEEDFINLLE